MTRNDRRQLRKILREIDNFLNQNTESSGALWDILTALRGPDSGNCVLKDCTTIPVRRMALPKTAQGYNDVVTNKADFRGGDYVAPVRNKFGSYDHFSRHIIDAKLVLDELAEKD